MASFQVKVWELDDRRGKYRLKYIPLFNKVEVLKKHWLYGWVTLAVMETDALKAMLKGEK